MNDKFFISEDDKHSVIRVSTVKAIHSQDKLPLGSCDYEYDHIEFVSIDDGETSLLWTFENTESRDKAFKRLKEFIRIFCNN